MVNKMESPQDSQYDNFLLQTVDYLDEKINANELSGATLKKYRTTREVILECAASYTVEQLIDESPKLEGILDRLDVGSELVVSGLTVRLSKEYEGSE